MECILENITVHYEVFGDGRPIVILPGWGNNTRIMAHILEPCFQQREGWKRIYIDPPGHGKTPGKEWISNQDMMLEVVLACIDKLTTGQKYSMIGYSLGAYLARGVILHRAEQIEGIVMIVPAIIAEDENRTIPPYKVMIEDPSVIAALTSEEKDLFGLSIIQSHKLLDYVRTFPQISEDENGDAEFLSKIRDYPENYAFSFDVDDVPEPFFNPALIITGRQDPAVGYKDAWNILDNYPRATYVVLDRVGHLLEERIDLVHVLIGEWMDRVEESINFV
jgi:pimeloyl-ACP methyl ester carboxylesterase